MTAGIPTGRELLQEFASDPSVDDGVADAAIQTDRDETVTVTVDTELRVEDQDPDRELFPASEYETLLEKRVPYEERFSRAPEGYHERSVAFIEPDRDLEPCSKCGATAWTVCPECEGDETVDCYSCDGTKRRTCEECSGCGDVSCDRCNGDAEVQCSNHKCTDGEVECPNCGGDQTCPECRGDQTEDCENCGGTGTTGTEEKQCPQCTGRMVIECPDCDGEDDNCSTCGGDYTAECPRCEGTGTETVEITCPECSGGTTSCSVCGGTGECDRCGGNATVNCPRCHGDGVRTCPDCEDGRVTCSECEGEMDVHCDRCDSEGRVDCETCNTEGKVLCDRCKGDMATVEAKQGELEFEVRRASRVDTEYVSPNHVDPDQYPTHHDPDRSRGESILEDDVDDTDQLATDGGTYRRRSEQYDLPAKKLEYTHHGNRYRMQYIDGELYYGDYPPSEDHLSEKIESMQFEYAPGRSTVRRVTGEPVRLVRDAATAAFAATGSTFVILVTTLLLALVVSGDSADPIVVGVNVVVGVPLVAAVGTYLRRNKFGTHPTDPAGERRSLPAPEPTYGSLLVPVLLCLGVAVVVVSDSASETVQFALAGAASVLWTARVSQRLFFEGNRALFEAEQRAESLDSSYESSVDIEDLRTYGLEGFLPDEGRRDDGERALRLSTWVRRLCWAPGIFFLSTLPYLVAVDSYPLFEYLGVNGSLAVPAVLAVVAALCLLPLLGHGSGATEP